MRAHPGAINTVSMALDPRFRGGDEETQSGLLSVWFAPLARSNSQFMREVFEAHAFAACVLFVGATHRFDFLR